MSFFELSSRGRAKQPPEIVIGWHVDGETTLNPPGKTESRTWNPEDMLVVLAED